MKPTPVAMLEKPMDRGAWQATIHGVAKIKHNLAATFKGKCFIEEKEMFLFVLLTFIQL